MSTHNMGSLPVSRVQIHMKTIREDDIYNSMFAASVIKNFRVRLHGWHEFDNKYMELAADTSGTSAMYDVSPDCIVIRGQEVF